jgi:hypothetical protein
MMTLFDILLTLFVLGFGGFRLLQRMTNYDQANNTVSGGSQFSNTNKPVFRGNYRYDRILKTIHLNPGQTVSSSELVDLLAPRLDGGVVRARQFVASPYVAAFVSDGDAIAQSPQSSLQSSTFTPRQVNAEQVTSTSSSLVEDKEKSAGSGAVFWDDSF